MKFCRKCGVAPRVSGTRSSGRPYIASYCVSCTALKDKISRDKRDLLGKCLSCGKYRETGKKRCENCALKMTLAVIARGRNAKVAAVKFLGGKCVDCGFKSNDVEVYDFHHLDPSQKSDGVGNLLRASWEKVVEELKKCVLLCSNCHRRRERFIDFERLKQRCVERGFDLPKELS